MRKQMKYLCLLLAVLLAASVIPYPQASASEVEQILPAEEETVAETAAETVPEMIAEPEETVPVETAPETEPPAETVPAETAPAVETVQVETIPSLEELAQRPSGNGYASVPLYFQTDYPDELYGGGSIANNGCSVTCLAMVASYLTGHEYLPDELARYFGGVAENNIERLEKGADTLQLPWEKMENFDTTMEALREGKVVIALMDSNSLFTETQHFIVLTGFNEDGLIMVKDPYEPSYDKWDVKRAFREGFTEGDICCGFSGAWAFDKNAMPEDPIRYYEEDLRGEPRYPHIQLTDEEKYLLARVVWVESRGESAEGQQAVAEVILNRLASDSFPNSLRSVIYADGQFRSVNYLEEATPEQAQFDAIDHAIYGPYILPEDVVHFATYQATKNVWGQIGGHYFCYQSE